jgi:hypothetical protein
MFHQWFHFEQAASAPDPGIPELSRKRCLLFKSLPLTWN